MIAFSQCVKDNFCMNFRYNDQSINKTVYSYKIVGNDKKLIS